MLLRSTTRFIRNALIIAVVAVGLAVAGFVVYNKVVANTDDVGTLLQKGKVYLTDGEYLLAMNYFDEAAAQGAKLVDEYLAVYYGFKAENENARAKEAIEKAYNAARMPDVDEGQLDGVRSEFAGYLVNIYNKEYKSKGDWKGALEWFGDWPDKLLDQELLDARDEALRNIPSATAAPRPITTPRPRTTMPPLATETVAPVDTRGPTTEPTAAAGTNAAATTRNTGGSGGTVAAGSTTVPTEAPSDAPSMRPTATPRPSPSASTPPTPRPTQGTPRTTDDNKPTYAINVVSGTGGRVSGLSDTRLAAGTLVRLTATANAGYEFAGWSSSSTAVTFANANIENTTVTMPSTSVTITANFKPKATPTPRPTPTSRPTAAPTAVPTETPTPKPTPTQAPRAVTPPVTAERPTTPIIEPTVSEKPETSQKPDPSASVKPSESPKPTEPPKSYSFGLGNHTLTISGDKPRTVNLPPGTVYNVVREKDGKYSNPRLGVTGSIGVSPGESVIITVTTAGEKNDVTIQNDINASSGGNGLVVVEVSQGGSHTFENNTGVTRTVFIRGSYVSNRYEATKLQGSVTIYDRLDTWGNIQIPPNGTVTITATKNDLTFYYPPE